MELLDDCTSNPTINLLRIIGSPFVKSNDFELAKNTALELYSLATKNKIGLLYLDSINSKGKINEMDLEEIYKLEIQKNKDQIFTAKHISDILNNFGANYAIFKSVMPFRATPNDIDIIHFGSENEFDELSKFIINSGYTEIHGDVDAKQRMFHDNRKCFHGNKHNKDIYDIDIYQEISASYIMYLDKTKLNKYIYSHEFDDFRFCALIPEAELLAIIIHSMIPEMIFTLFVYYSTLFYIKKFNSNNLALMYKIMSENRLLNAARAHFSLVAALHHEAHGFTPDSLDQLINFLQIDHRECKSLDKNNYNMPYKYNIYTLVKIIFEKMHERIFRKSMGEQLKHMLNPKMTKWVISNLIWRRRRDTY